MSRVVEFIGDNKECGLATLQDYTFHMSDTTKTSANDTDTDRYFNNYLMFNNLVIRADQHFQIVSINGVTFTDPCTVYKNTPYIQTDISNGFEVVIKTLTANTNIKIRVTGRKVIV